MKRDCGPALKQDGVSRTPIITDFFTDDRRPGRVVGTAGASGAVRGGCDVERQIAIDHGALRLQPLITPGWGRQGIAYGPFSRTHGLTFAVSVLNGHNTSQGSSIPEPFKERIRRWALGFEVDPLSSRIWGWLKAPRKRKTFRRIAWWLRSTRRFYQLPEFNENLAVGWFTSEAPQNPLTDGCGFIMHAAEGENGEPWVRIGAGCLSPFRRLQNVRVTYVVSLRDRGAIYYASAIDGAHAVGGFPMMRPIAVDPFNDDSLLYAGVHQCVLGQIGWRADSRVHGVHIEQMPEFASAFGSAQAGDDLLGSGPLGCEMQSGLPWRLLGGAISRTDWGAVSGTAEGDALAIVEPEEPSGLVHALVRVDCPSAQAGLAWRVRDSRAMWLLKVSVEGCALLQIEDGIETCVAEDREHCLTPNSESSIQVLDSDNQVGCYMDGARLFGRWINDACLDGSTGTGIWFGGGGTAHIRGFEAHARRVAMPERIRFEPSWCRLGETVELADDFAGPQGDLAGHKPTVGEGCWQRTLGAGRFGLTGSGAGQVCGTPAAPHPGRSFYTLPWGRPDFADVEMTITPPGHKRGEGHNCRCGFVFWQDKDNYLSITTWILDNYEGASICVFPKRFGFEELFDAVWTMVSDKITWGKPFNLRVPFDGNNFMILLNGEPVLERALTDIYPGDAPVRINRVGIAVNWEWGNDTGSKFENFFARA